MKTITLTNDFHNTTAAVRPGNNGVLSSNQVKRLRNKLCGISGYLCGGAVSERGKQPVEIIDDGSVYLVDLT